MCGIVLTNTNIEGIERHVLARIERRGPDYQDMLRFKNIFIGHTRLSIIDLDNRSNQPFERGDLLLTYNGEIYNYKALRNELSTLGYTFRTESDTEVLLYLYQEYGKDCLHKISGMFAFCVFDKVKNTLFFARDITGQKPLYYYFKDGELTISSSLALIFDLHKPERDYDALEEYFRFRYIVSNDRTPFLDCKKLEPGCFGIVDLNTSSLTIEPYFNSVEYVYEGSFNEAKLCLKELIEDSVKERMISDVPLGIFLSGGLDSSIIAYHAAQNFQQVNTFSLGFEGLESNELKSAREIAKHLKTRHHEVVVKPDEVRSVLDDFFQAYEEPFADGSAVPSLILSKFARNHMTVALSGDGADELFLGYNRYEYFSTLLWQQNIPKQLKAVFSFLSVYFRRFSWSKYLRLLGSSSKSELYHGIISSFDTREFNTIETGLKTDLNNDLGPVKSVANWDKRHYLSNDINQKIDRASMFYGLEVRSPFLAKQIQDFASSLPETYMYFNGKKKHILRSLLYDLMPSKLYKMKKFGFTAPIEVWIESIFREEIIEYINGDDLLELPFINIDGMRAKCKEHFQGKRKHTNMLWRVLVYKKWSSLYV